MPDIKEKPKMGKPKGKSKADLLPKQTARMMKEKYIRQLKQHPEQTETGDGYAAGQVEDAGRWTVDTLVDTVVTHRPRMEKAKKTAARDTDTEGQDTPDHAPRQEANPATNTTNSRVPEQSANPPKERRLVEQRTASSQNGGHNSSNTAGRSDMPVQSRGAPKGQSGRKPVPKASGQARNSPGTQSAPLSRQASHSIAPAPTPWKAPEQGTYDIPRSPRLQKRGVENSTSKAPGHTQAPSMAGDRRTAAQAARINDRRQGRLTERPVPTKDTAGATGPRKGKHSIKERQRTAFSPKTRASTKAGPKTAATGPKTGRAIGKQAANKARQQARHQAIRHMAAQTAKAAKLTAETARRVAVAVVKAAAAAIGAVAGIAGGAVLVVALIVVVVIAAVANSPFGLFFAQEQNSPDTVSVAQAVATVNIDFNARLESLQAGEYDSITVEGQPPAWADVLAVFAAKTAGADSGVDVATLDADRIAKLTAVFWDMTSITATPEEIEHPAIGNTPAWTEKKLTITITPKTADDMRTAYAFTEYQNNALDELLADRAALTSLAGDLSITDIDARELLAALPEDLSPQRREVVETACRLVGKVNYFWGGKSLVLGWDARWGQLQKVWAEGSPTTGTYRPYGLDCSGFADWVFYNMSGGAYIIGHGGGAHAQHTYCTDIDWDEAQPGDLVFYPEDEHVGIVGGRDENGALLVIHCASGHNNVVITGVSGFTSVARPDYYAQWG